MTLLQEVNTAAKVWESATPEEVAKYIKSHKDAKFDIARMRSGSGVMTLIDVDDAYRVRSDVFWSSHVKKTLADKSEDEKNEYTRARLLKLLDSGKISEFETHRIK